MGIIICPQHGRAGFHETCEHVDAELRSGFCNLSNRRSISLNVLACNACWGTYDLDRFEGHPDISGKHLFEADEESPAVKECEGIYEKLRHSCWCVTCISELQAKGTGGSGETPPDNSLKPIVS